MLQCPPWLLSLAFLHLSLADLDSCEWSVCPQSCESLSWAQAAAPPLLRLAEQLDGAGRGVQVDAGLRQLRFRMVPRLVSEARFWGRYFAACAAIRRDVLQSAAASATTCASLAPAAAAAAAAAASRADASHTASELPGMTGCRGCAAPESPPPAASAAAASVVPVFASPAAAATSHARAGGGSPAALWPDMSAQHGAGSRGSAAPARMAAA